MFDVASWVGATVILEFPGGRSQNVLLVAGAWNAGSDSPLGHFHHVFLDTQAKDYRREHGQDMHISCRPRRCLNQYHQQSQKQSHQKGISKPGGRFSRFFDSVQNNVPATHFDEERTRTSNMFFTLGEVSHRWNEINL